MISAGNQVSSVSSNEALLKAAGEALAQDIRNGGITKGTLKKLEQAGVDVSTFKVADNKFSDITKAGGGIKAGLHADRAPVSSSIKGDTFRTKAAFNLISKNPALAPYVLAGIVDELHSNA